MTGLFARLGSLCVCVICCCVVSAQEVTLPLESYESLRARAEPKPTPEPVPPLPITIDSAHVEIVIGEDSARVVQQIELSILADGWKSVEIPSIGTFVAADLGDLEGRVSSAGGWTLRVRGPGRHLIELESLVALVEEESSARKLNSLAIDLPKAAVIDGKLRPSAWVEEVEILSGAIGRNRSGDGTWLFAGSGGEVMRIHLFGAATAPRNDDLPLRFEAVSTTATTVDRSRTTAETTLVLSVLQGTLDPVAVTIPENFRVVNAEGSGLAGWDLVDRSVLLTPLDSQARHLSVSLLLTADAVQQLSTPVVVPAEAVRTLFAVSVSVTGDGLLELQDEGSGRLLTAAERGRLPQKTATGSALILAVDDPMRVPQWQVTWAEGGEVLASQVDRLRVEVTAGTAGIAAYRCWAEVRSTGARSLVLGFPAGFELVAASRDNMTVHPGLAADGLVIPLANSATAELVFVEGLVPLAIPDEGELVVAMPRLSAPAARIEARLSLPPNRRYESTEPGRLGFAGSRPAAERSAVGTDDALVAWLRSAPTTARDTVPAVGLTAPPDFELIEFAWSALSSEPDPIRLKIKGDRIAREWF